MRFYVIVRGLLGAGKTTVAHHLAAALRATVVSIDEILEERPWDGGSEALFLDVNHEAAERAAPGLGRGAPVIFDGNFGTIIKWIDAIQVSRNAEWLAHSVGLATRLGRHS